MLAAQSCPNLCNPWTVAHQALCPWNSPGKNTGVGCSALQEIFQTQGWNLCLLHWWVDSLPPSHQSHWFPHNLRDCGPFLLPLVSCKLCGNRCLKYSESLVGKGRGTQIRKPPARSCILAKAQKSRCPIWRSYFSSECIIFFNFLEEKLFASIVFFYLLK